MRPGLARSSAHRPDAWVPVGGVQWTSHGTDTFCVLTFLVLFFPTQQRVQSYQVSVIQLSMVLLVRIQSLNTLYSTVYNTDSFAVCVRNLTIYLLLK